MLSYTNSVSISKVIKIDVNIITISLGRKKIIFGFEHLGVIKL